MGRILDRLKGDALRRRVIAGRVGGLLWLFAAVATPVLTLLPGVDVQWPRAMAAMAVSAVIWGVLATFAIDDILTREQVAWILAHHERPDGRGYPAGVTEIPDGAALLAAADCFDVMTVARPYSRAKSEAEALAECRSLIGSQFTAEAVAALEAAVEPERAAAA
jgi:hypothetical protein